mmetsp:Transcript_27019/g.51098  ORF Transcript_27019/g.51098 Transcript_27019/m.51098 type:complete len:393 (-) Transcript_27019:170-1348(-)
MSSRPRCRISQLFSGRTFLSGRRTISIQALTTQLLLLTLTVVLLHPQPCQSIHLDIHVPLSQGCLEYYALLANRLLREASRPSSSSSSQLNNETTGADQTEEKGEDDKEVSQPSEHVDLFMRHTPHVTLYLADFDLEVDEEAVDDTDADGAAAEDAAQTANDIIDQAARALNLTKVAAFKDTIASLNFTEIISGWNCPLTFSVPEQDQQNQPTSSSSSYYKINGAYVMLPIENTPCLQTLSTTLLHTLQSYLKHPVLVPSWVASLAEPLRSSAIFRSRTYGSPNVLEGFDPHVTVGFDETVLVVGSSDADSSSERSSLQWRVEAMEEWNDAYQTERETCSDEVQGIALGKTGVGGTVLSDSRMGYWKFEETKKAVASVSQSAHGDDIYAVVG